MWMDWDRDYYTFSDTNIEYIWRFLAEVHRRGWLYQGHRSTVWCPRCGTSISQHEVFSGEYRELEHPSLYVRLPLKGREGESLVVWTTTPWTLPANVAAAVNPAADYGLTEDGEWWAVARKPDTTFVRSALGGELVGLEYEGPFDHVPAQEGVVHRVIPWDDVSLDEGTGIVHIAPGAGAEDFELSRVHDLPVLAPLDEAGRMLPEFGFDGLSTDDVARPVIDDLETSRAASSRPARSSTATRRAGAASTPLVFRVVDDWFIAADEVRQPMLDANATVEWTPDFYSKRMDDWLRNMGDWNISRKRYFGLPLPFYPCSCGHLTVVGSRAELEERAVRGLEQLQELHRPWIDEVVIRCEACGEEVRRVPEVGDAWLDAGIVPLSTLGWESGDNVFAGYGTGAAKGLTLADLPDHAYWEEWFPADWVSEMREQIRLWFYSISFMSVTLVGRSPYRRVLDVREAAGRDRPRDAPLVGERDRGGRGARADGRGRHALAVLLAAAEPEPPLRLRPRARDPAEAAHALELVQVPRRLREHRRLDARVGRRSRRARAGSSSRSTAGSSSGRTRSSPRRPPAYESWLTVDVVRAYEVVRRRRLELVHPAFASAVLGRRPGRAAHALVRARPGAARRRSADAVPHGSPLARADRAVRGRAGVGASRRLAGRGRAGLRLCSRRSRSCVASSSSDARRARPRA